ncbi:hypothetical protein CKAH01_10732 [Colletotrichum kahawae]|uniref:Uncharacterized protein n=1 Tax=Colletotrichum kahawae TaxID=34407 RepID=A0AAD9XVI4_COLKA|nr:hypothetical protein CKAH01_10732 [Colletotrichum kahawae]
MSGRGCHMASSTHLIPPWLVEHRKHERGLWR